MALSWVQVVGATKGRDVFVGSNDIDAAGQVCTPFQVQTGRNTFRLLRDDGSEEARRVVTVTAHDKATPQIVDFGGAERCAGQAAGPAVGPAP
jgi:hypothetical protein